MYSLCLSLRFCNETANLETIYQINCLKQYFCQFLLNLDFMINAQSEILILKGLYYIYISPLSGMTQSLILKRKPLGYGCG